MAWLIRSVNPFVVTSIFLSITTWAVVCHSFLLNSGELMSVAISISSNRSENIQLSYDILAFIVITHLVHIIFEAVMIGLLVIQFLSSFDCLTREGQEYRRSWMEFHRKIFPLHFVILLFCFFIFLSSMNFYFIYEVLALTINFLFLLTVIGCELEGLNILSQGQGINGRDEDNKQEKCSISPSTMEEYGYNINLSSFLETKHAEDKNNKNIRSENHIVII